MLWKEVKSWAKDKGYKVDRTKISNEEDNETSYLYKWSKIDDPSVSGETSSVSKVATVIYNHITNNEFVEYQKQYAADQAKKEIKHETGGW